MELSFITEEDRVPSTILTSSIDATPNTPALFVEPQQTPFVPLSSLRRGATVWGMVGVSEALRKLQDRIRSAATSELSVLIIGETGSGKELVANAIHQESKRSHARFVAVNTGAIPRELVASELFGHVRGAFTGALKDREGRFVEADGGTLFLDELGTMDARTQIGLLRALEQRVIQPVGSGKEIPVNVRIVAATNANLLNEVKTGNFREDLYYRLESFVIPVPPLRNRREDIPALAAFFAEKVALDDGRTLQGFMPDVLQYLCAYDWPGNIRELRNAISQAVILASDGIVQASHLPDKLVQAPKPREVERVVVQTTPPPALSNPPHTPPQTGRTEENKPRALSGPSTQIALTLDDGLDAMVVQIMQKTLEVCNGNVTRAAQVLGISRKTIYNRLRSEGFVKDRNFIGGNILSRELNDDAEFAPGAPQPAAASRSQPVGGGGLGRDDLGLVK
jgi:DNA-binding NtrC family response regulator